MRGSRTPTDPFSRARSTGPLNLVVDLDSDEMVARVQQIGPNATVDRVERELQDFGIATGIRHEAIADAVRLARKTGAPVLGVVVAQGVRPKRGGAARVVMRPPRDLDTPADVELLAELVERGAASSIRRLVARGLKGWLARPGDILCVVVVDGGEPGVDLRGRVRPAPAGRGAAMAPPGPGVGMSADGRSLVAQRLGYVGLIEGRLSVVPLVALAPDDSEAWGIRMPVLGGTTPPTPDELASALTAAGVTHGASGTDIDSACAGWPTAETPVADFDAALQIAAAVPPTDPVQGEPVYEFDHAFRAATEDEDGRVDFKERNVFPAVVAGGLLAVCPPTTPGVPGRSVRGKPVPPRVFPPTEMVAGENVVRHEENGEQRLFATSDGGATTQSRTVISRVGRRARHKLAVRPVAIIRGDVSYGTGHVRFNGNVEVHGSVCAGFDVFANGDVAVKGRVEDGARVGAMGGVTVAGGVLGAETKISGRDCVTVRFVQDARIRAGGDLEIRNYAHDAQLEALGEIRVLSRGGRRAGLVGGVAWGATGVVAHHVGSASNPNTIVVAGVDRGRVEALAAVRLQLSGIERDLRKLLKALGMRTPDELARTFIDPERDDPRAAAFGAAQSLFMRAVELREKREALLSESKALARRAEVTARRTIYAGSRVRVGPFTTQVELDRNGVRYHLDPTGERRGVQASPASHRR